MAEIEYKVEEVEEEGTEEVLEVTSDPSGVIEVKPRDDMINVYDLDHRNKTSAPWLSTEVFVQGCYKNCPGCFNQVLRRFDIHRHVVTPEELAEELIRSVPYKCVTFSGGEPMLYAKGLAKVAKILKANGFTIVCYTGYQADELPYLFPASMEFIRYIDVLVDGMFMQQLLTPIRNEYEFVGSSNQRIIDMQLSLKEKRCILWSDEKTKSIINGESYKKFFEGMEGKI